LWCAEAKKEAEAEEGGLQVPSLVEILKLRMKPEDEVKTHAFEFFVGRILGGAVGNRKWSTKRKAFHPVSSSRAGITPSDEAFALVVLENIWDTVFPPVAGGAQDNKNTKYTGKRVPGTSNKKFEGWSRQGIDRFNYLCQFARENREEEHAKEIEERVVEQLREKYFPSDLLGFVVKSPSEVSRRKKRCHRSEGEEEAVVPVTDFDLFQWNRDGDNTEDDDSTMGGEDRMTPV